MSYHDPCSRNRLALHPHVSQLLSLLLLSLLVSPPPPPSRILRWVVVSQIREEPSPVQVLRADGVRKRVRGLHRRVQTRTVVSEVAWMRTCVSPQVCGLLVGGSRDLSDLQGQGLESVRRWSQKGESFDRTSCRFAKVVFIVFVFLMIILATLVFIMYGPFTQLRIEAW
ncbi:hypothetical protein Bca101_007847 [Brassica carinata]